MPLARASEMVAGPSIKAFPSAWARGHDRGGDFMCMALPVAERALAVPDRVSMPLDTQESVLMKARMVKHLLQNAERKATSTSGRRSASTSSGRTCFGNSVNPSAAIDRLRRLLCTGINKVAAVEAAAGAAEEPQQGSTLDRTHGFDALMTFVPQIIRQRCLEGMSLDMLAENRMVSLMFMVSSFEVSLLQIHKRTQSKPLRSWLHVVGPVAEFFCCRRAQGHGTRSPAP